MIVFIVAELSANHNRNLNLAKESLYAIKEIGASAIKLQTYTPDSLTLECKSNIFKIKSNTIWDGKYLYDLYKDAAMPLEWNYELFTLAKKIGLLCFSSAFDKNGVDLLEELNNPIYKIASFEITDIPLIKYIASKNKPIILSSGIATDEEINDAIKAILSQNNNDITLLKCTSKYPAPLNSMELIRMVSDAKKYNVKYGLSDHSLGNKAAIIATTLKASIIEKHFILDKKYSSVDSNFSMDKNEFSSFIQIINDTISALGNYKYDITINEQISKKDISKIDGREFARSLFICKDIKKGDLFSEYNIRSIRPNNGLPPKYLNKILGKKASKDLEYGKPLEYEDIVDINF